MKEQPNNVGRHSRASNGAPFDDASKPVTSAAEATKTQDSQAQPEYMQYTPGQRMAMAQDKAREDARANLPKYVYTRPTYIDPEFVVEKQRKARTRKHLIRTGIALLVIAALGVGGYFLYGFMNESKTAEANLKKAQELVTAADATILTVDEAVCEELSTDSLTTIPEIIDAIPEAQNNLVDALNLVKSAQNAYLSDDNVSLAAQLAVSIKSRQDMLEQGRLILESDIAAANAMAILEKAWTNIIEGYNLATEAFGSKAGSSAALGLEDQALEKFETASDLFVELDMSYGLADFSAITDYIDKETVAIKYARLADKAYSSSKSKYNAYIEKFNTANTEAAKLAEALPADPVSTLSAAYQVNAKDYMDDYFDARERAAKADSNLRSYLGLDDPTASLLPVTEEEKAEAEAEETTAEESTSEDASATENKEEE